MNSTPLIVHDHSCHNGSLTNQEVLDPLVFRVLFKHHNGSLTNEEVLDPLVFRVLFKHHNGSLTNQEVLDPLVFRVLFKHLSCEDEGRLHAGGTLGALKIIMIIMKRFF